MTAKCALIMAFLNGRILNVKNCFTEIGLSNISREVPRLIEEPFGCIISRVKMEGKSRYGNVVTYTNFRLNPTIPGNSEAIQKMKEYLKEHLEMKQPRTSGQQQKFDQLNLFLNQ